MIKRLPATRSIPRSVIPYTFVSICNSEETRNRRRDPGNGESGAVFGMFSFEKDEGSDEISDA